MKEVKLNPQYTENDNPLVQGIKIIGVGKHGSKSLPENLVQQISEYLNRAENIIPIQLGAFYGALLAKGPTEVEKKNLLTKEKGVEISIEQLYQAYFSDTPSFMKEIGQKLLQKENLSLSEAEQLGDYLFSNLPGEAFRGMAANMLRIRYETEEEYHGLLKAAESTYTAGFKKAKTGSGKLIQLAEPFDGVTHSYMITPLLAEALQQAGYQVVTIMGRSSGPKLLLNSLNLFKLLEAGFLQNTEELRKEAPRYGWALNQQDLSPALDQWVARRRLIFKRPFLATLEKVLNPCGAQILITSVFHITYMEKMVALAGMAGFSGVIVLKRGLEGSLAPSLAKASGILCAAKQSDGSFLTQTFSAEDETYTNLRREMDENIEPLYAEDNLQLIRQFSDFGATENSDFDNRVKLGTALFKKGLAWIHEKTGH